MLDRINVIDLRRNRANPKDAGTVSVDRQHAVAAQAVRVAGIIVVRGEALRRTIKIIQAARERTEPEVTIGVLRDRIDLVAAQTVRIVRIVLVRGGLPGRWIEQV